MHSANSRRGQKDIWELLRRLLFVTTIQASLLSGLADVAGGSLLPVAVVLLDGERLVVDTD